MWKTKKFRDLLERTEEKCFYCGIPFDGERIYPIKEHFFPKSKGGKLVVPSCARCNSIKSDLTIEEFRLFANNYALWSWRDPLSHKDYPILQNNLFFFERKGLQI